MIKKTSVRVSRQVITDLAAVVVGMAFLLVACSRGGGVADRGGNVPSTWKGHETITKIACESPQVLDVNSIHQGCIEKLSKSSTGDAANAPARYVVRTILTKDVSNVSTTGAIAADQPGAINISGLPAQQTLEQYHKNENNLNIQVNDRNCENLEATYSGPGLSQPLRGRIKGISHRAIIIENVDPASGSITTVTLSVDRPGRASGKMAAFQKYQDDLNKGLYSINIKIDQTAKSADGATATRTIEILQKSISNEDEDVEVHTSVLSPMFIDLDGVTTSSPESQELLKLYNEAVSNKEETVTVPFSKLMKMHSEVSLPARDKK